MALSVVEICKLLPKIDCKKCGYPTCLDFARAVAEKKASLDQCLKLSEEAKRILEKEGASNSK